MSLLAAIVISVSPAPVVDRLSFFEGAWQCEGYFVPSMKAISSTMEIQFGASKKALHVTRTDLPPGKYSAVEIWGSAGESGSYRATIADAFSGVRWYTSPGWVGDRWVWKRVRAEGEPEEEFVYTRLGDSRLRIDWNIARNGAALSLGDTVVCQRQ